MSDPKTTIAAYTASVVTFALGWVTSNPASLVGALCALGTFLVNWYYKHRQLKIIEARADLPVDEE